MLRRATVQKQRRLWTAISGSLSTKGRHKKGLLQQIHANRTLPKQNTIQRKERYDKKKVCPKSLYIPSMLYLELLFPENLESAHFNSYKFQVT